MTISVSQLGYMVVKSTRETKDVRSLRFDEFGCFGDREFMFVEASEYTNKVYQVGQISGPGHFISQREDPILTQISGRLTSDGIELSFGASKIIVPFTNDESNRIDVSVWSWNGTAIDQGDEAAQWVSDLLGRPARLVRRDQVKPRFVNGDDSQCQMGFADGLPLLVTSVASMNQVNNWLEAAGKDPVPADRYRANIVLDGVEAFGEDLIESLTFGEYKLERVSACPRCPIPDIDQRSGERTRAVRSVLGKNGRRGVRNGEDGVGIMFGQNFKVSASSLGKDGLINLGDKPIVEMGEPNWSAT